MNILLVDDEPEYRMLVAKYLTDEGYTVFSSEHGEAALKIMDDTTIDFIISDVYMPVMDGLKFHKAVRAKKEYEKIPFLFVSGFDDDYTLSAVKSSKYNGFMKKARHINELKAWITYLTIPIEKRPSIPPSVSTQQPARANLRDRSSRYNR